MVTPPKAKSCWNTSPHPTVNGSSRSGVAGKVGNAVPVCGYYCFKLCLGACYEAAVKGLVPYPVASLGVGTRTLAVLAPLWVRHLGLGTYTIIACPIYLRVSECACIASAQHTYVR